MFAFFGRKAGWLAAVVWMLGPALGLGAVAHFGVEVWNTEHGLPGNAVIAMAQTRDGYLWLGTRDGLARFDGIHFTTFNEGNTPGLTSSRIVKLFEDSHANLWIGTETAEILVVRDGRIKRVDISTGTRQEILRSICEDAHGAVWLYTASGLLYRLMGDQRNIGGVGAGFPSLCRALAIEDNLLWVGTDQSLTLVGPLPSGQTTNVPFFGTWSLGKLDSLLTSRRGYWRLAEGRIQKWNLDRLEKDWAYPWPSNLTVSAVCEDREGNLIVGTDGDGVYWFEADGSFSHLSAGAKLLSHGTILSLVVDQEGCLWVGTNGGGLNRVKRQVFQLLPGTEGRTVQSVCADGHGGLWIGYNYDIVDHWSNGSLRHFTDLTRIVSGFLPPQVKNVPVRSVFSDQDDQLWVGTDLGGLLRFRDGQFELAERLHPMLFNEITSIFQDRSRHLWVGTQKGLARWDGKTWKAFTTAEGLSANSIRALAEDRAGNLWIGTEGGGLNRMRGDRFVSLTKTNGLPSNNILALHCDDQGVLWVGTSSGLARVKEEQVASYAACHELAGQRVGYLLEDAEGYLWLGSSTGLIRARKQDLNELLAHPDSPLILRSYGSPDGLPAPPECTQGSQPAACRTADGTLLFPTIGGLVSITPASLRPNTNLPPVLIEAVRLFPADLPGAANVLRCSPPRAITVPAGKESLEIYYTSLCLSAPDRGSFRYRLEGYEKEWTTRPGSIRSVRYPKLPPGSYTFRVTACNEDGTWNHAGASVAITVLPPFWQTWWFLSLTALCLLGAIVGSVHYVSTQRLHRQLAALRQKEALEKERARIARDLHDQLGANLTQVALLGEMAESDKDLPGEVEGHARQISQTARETTRALDEIVWTVNPSNDTLDGLINYVCKYAQEYLALANLRYRIEVPPQLPALVISPELRHNVFLAAKEAVNNIVKHSQATSAWLRLELAADHFVLEIADNGRGLDAHALNKGRNGLRNMRKRLEEIGGQFDLIPATDGGTKVRLTAPLRRPNDSNSHPQEIDTA